MRRAAHRAIAAVTDDLEALRFNRAVARGGVEIALSQREFEVLAYFLRHKNATVTRGMLGRDVWKEPGYTLTNVIDVYINSLRKQQLRPIGRTRPVGDGFGVKIDHYRRHEEAATGQISQGSRRFQCDTMQDGDDGGVAVPSANDFDFSLDVGVPSYSPAGFENIRP